MAIFIEQPASQSDVEQLTRDVVIGILSILSALTIRELLVEATEFITPREEGTSSPTKDKLRRRKLVFVAFLAALTFLFTIIIVTVWRV